MVPLMTPKLRSRPLLWRLKKKERLLKNEEFPKIDWKNLSDPQIQKAELIYSDRVNLHRDLVALDRQLDDSPTQEAVIELVEKSIRNRVCFDELRSFNNQGRFLDRHPFVRVNDEFSRLKELLLTAPDDFMKEYRNAGQNVSRYKAKLNGKSLTDEKRESLTELLRKWSAKEEIMRECLKMNLYGRNQRV